MCLLKISKIMIMGLVLLVATACTALNTKVGGMLDLDTDLKISFLVDADVNPDDNKIPSPLVIRMYELKTPNLFKKANFIDLYEKDEEVLGADMVSKEKLKYMQPGETRETSFVLKEETKYVGLFAEFLQYKDAKYKLIIPVAQTNVFSSSAAIRLSNNKLILLSKEVSYMDAASESEQ